MKKYEVRTSASEVKYSDVRKYGNVKEAFEAQYFDDYLKNNKIVASFNTLEEAKEHLAKKDYTYIRDNYGMAIKYWFIEFALIEENEYDEDGEITEWSNGETWGEQFPEFPKEN